MLRARPDLALPAPRSIEAIVARASAPGSLTRAVEGLNAFLVQLLAGVLVLPPPVTSDTLSAAVSGQPGGGEELRREVSRELPAALLRLQHLALVYPSGEGLRSCPGLESVLPYPAGLGRPLASLRSALPPASVAARLASLSAPAVALLRSLDRAGVPVGRGRLPDGPGASGSPTSPSVSADTPLQAAVAAGLLVPTGSDTVELPREVGLSLRGDWPLGPPRVQPPLLSGVKIGQRAVDEAGAATVAELLRNMESLLTALGRAPAAAVRTGGIGIRELRSLSRVLDSDDAATALLLEVSYAAGLVDSDAADTLFAPTTAYDSWQARPAADQWATLVGAWRDMTRRPSLAGGRDDRDRPVGVLGPSTFSYAARDLRRLVLRALTGAPPGVAARDLLPWLTWAAPAWSGPAFEDLVAMTLAEAAALGVAARGALSSAGRALASDGPAAAAAVLAPLLPSPVDHVVLQADLTAVAPGPLRPELAAEFDLLAEVESTGAATVYRFSETSIRRALDAGRSATAVHGFLATVSRTPVPQNLDYLVDDVARRHGRLRTAAAAAYLRCEDAGLLDAVCAERRGEPLGLRRIAPTVAIAKVSPTRVLEVLRQLGYAPVAEDNGGTMIAAGRAGRRVPARPRWGGYDLAAPSPEQVSALVQRLRDTAGAGEATAGAPGAVLLALRKFTDSRARVRLTYLDSGGGAVTAVVQPEEMGGGRLVAFDEATHGRRLFPLSRVVAAVPA